MMLSGTAVSTNVTYAARQHAFMDFCEDSGGCPAPASEETLLAYVVALNNIGLKASTISGHLSAIRHLNIINGSPDPMIGQERLLLVKRGLAKRASPAELRAAVTNQHILAFLPLLDLTAFEDACFFAMCCLGFYGFLRISELTYPDSSFSPENAITSVDLTWAPGRISLLLRRSKTDVQRKGVTVVIGENSSPVCAVKSLQHYLSMRRASLPSLIAATSPLFVTPVGLPVSKAGFSNRLSALSARVGVEGLVTPHSLRIGAATAAWRAGYSDSQIMALGRWKSRAFLAYIRVDADTMAAMNSKLAATL